MTEYEELRGKITPYIRTAYPHETLNQWKERTADDILSIIAERCWFKDDTLLFPENPYAIPLRRYDFYKSFGWEKCWLAYHKAGWRPVKEIKKEAK